MGRERARTGSGRRPQAHSPRLGWVVPVELSPWGQDWSQERADRERADCLLPWLRAWGGVCLIGHFALLIVAADHRAPIIGIQIVVPGFLIVSCLNN